MRSYRIQFMIILVLLLIAFLIFDYNSAAENINPEIESLKKQILEIQIQNQKMIEEIQRKNQKQIDELKYKIESLESQTLKDKENIEELKVKNNTNINNINEIIDKKLESYDKYLPKLKFNTDFPSYFRSRGRFIENGTFFSVVPNEEDQIFFADSRLLLSPMLEITDRLSLRSQLDIAKNIVWGGIGDENSAEKVFEAPSPSDSFRGAILRDVTDTFSGNRLSPVDSDTDYFDIRTLYFVAETDIGELWVGRQPYDWGLGILNNAGSMPDQDLGTIVDRFEFDTAPLSLIDKKWDKLILAVTVDRLSQGNTLTTNSQGNGWEMGIGTIYFGDVYEFGGYIYLVNQNDFNLTNGLTGDLDNAVIWSLYFSYNPEPYFISFEFENIFGSVNDLEEPLGAVLSSDEIDITAENYLLAIRTGFRRNNSLLNTAFIEFGFASGDDASTTDKLEGSAIYFNNAFVVDNLLYKHMIPNIYALEGSVINSGYVRLYSTFKLMDSLYFSPQLLSAWIDENNALLDIDGITPMPEVDSYLGTELEGTITYKIHNNLWFDLIGTVVISGSGLEDLLTQRAFIEGAISNINESNPPDLPYAIQGRFIFTLDSKVKEWAGSSTLMKRWYQ